MRAQAYPLSYDKYKCTLGFEKASNTSSIHLMRLCFNNDYLLRHHSISFAHQIRVMADNGFILNRRVYEKIRKGEYKTVQYNWISYITNFWQDEYNYTFNAHDLQSENFIELIK